MLYMQGLPDFSRGYLDNPVEKPEEGNTKKYKIPNPQDQEYLVVNHVESQDTDCIEGGLPTTKPVPG